MRFRQAEAEGLPTKAQRMSPSPSETILEGS
jgi:hypothetical protein